MFNGILTNMNNEPIDPTPLDDGNVVFSDLVINELRKLDIHLSGDGTLGCELDRNLLLANPNFRLLFHDKRPGLHPEVPCGIWTGTMSIPTAGECKVIIEDQPIAPRISFVCFSQSWKEGFFPRLAKTAERAARIEAGLDTYTLPEELTKLLTTLWNTFEEHQNLSSWRLSMRKQAYDDQIYQAESDGSQIQKRLWDLSVQISRAFDSLQ